MIITYDEPGILYDDPRVTYDGVFTDMSLWPGASDVILGVQYGPTGVDFTGTAVAGNGATTIAYRSDVHISTQTLHTSSCQARREVSRQEQGVSVSPKRAQSKYAYANTVKPRIDVFTEVDQMSVTTTTETTSV